MHKTDFWFVSQCFLIAQMVNKSEFRLEFIFFYFGSQNNIYKMLENARNF